jgi:hypothetical protein
MDYSFKTQPFKHQLDALMQSYNKKDFAYFMEMGCVDEDTEFLTNRGWIKFLDFDLDTWERPLLVAQAIPETGTLEKVMANWSFEFVEPIAFIKKPAYTWYKIQEETSAMARNTPSFMFTPDHTTPFRLEWETKTASKSYAHSRPYPEATAEYLVQTINKDPKRKDPVALNQTYRFQFVHRCTHGLRGFNSDYFKPDPELSNLTEWELRFMVACIADGTFPNRTNNKCVFQFIKKRKADRLEMLAIRAGIPMALEMKKRKGLRKDKPDTVYQYHSIAPMRCKIFDERWYTLTQEQLEIVVNEVFHWDGYQGDKASEFFTVHKESADFIQYALMASGWGARLHFNITKNL